MLRLTTARCVWGGRAVTAVWAAAAAASASPPSGALWTTTSTSSPNATSSAPARLEAAAASLARRPRASRTASSLARARPSRGVLRAALAPPPRRRPLLLDRPQLRRFSDDPPPPPARRENIYTVPNLLTVARLAAAPVVGYCIVADRPGWALALLAAASATDLLDGWVARRWHLHTVVGSILDPMADKVLMTVLAVSLAAQGSLPLWLAALILGRDAGLGAAAVYYRWVSLPPPKTLARYWDFSLPSAEVRPTTISKYNTFLQLALMAATTAAPVLATAASLPGGPWDLGPALAWMQYLVALTTVWSGLSYVFSKDAVRILTKRDGGGRGRS